MINRPNRVQQIFLDDVFEHIWFRERVFDFDSIYVYFKGYWKDTVMLCAYGYVNHNGIGPKYARLVAHNKIM